MGLWNRDNANPNPELGADGKPKTDELPKTEAVDNAKLIADSIKSALEPLTQRMAAIEANTRKPVPAQERREIPSVLDDEDAAFASRMTPIAARQLELEARMALDDVKEEFVEAGFDALWREGEAEIKKVLSGSPLVGPDGNVCRGNPDYIRNVADMVFGRAMKKAGVRFGGKDKSFFLESSTSGDAGRAEAKESEGLTAEQLKIASRMKIPLADFKKTVASLKFDR